ncbi:hypothetical protein PV396_24465 [Streptomyces sp. ME02-8801-2C]|uniref:hypothetical protein n=1 Tax=Streptomyces sp. ME02-8801-2C TaxID=3028680 RepID=UPI0029B90BA6|nr:hypothetical protein [Streptomyces sp. ME02-8801-2C]MDX3455056.1 hypothetical protein [Streptomyces sp. ME02-8801-2C]
MAEQNIGQLIDALGVQADLEEGDLPTDAFVILKVVKADGTVSLASARSEGLDWITRLGMVTAAQEIENSGYTDTSTVDTD